MPCDRLFDPLRVIDYVESSICEEAQRSNPEKTIRLRFLSGLLRASQ